MGKGRGVDPDSELEGDSALMGSIYPRTRVLLRAPVC